MKMLAALLFSLSLIICCSDNTPTISYQQAPLESVLTCCGYKKTHDTHYIIFSRAATPKKTVLKECIRPENVFYRIAEYPSGEISLTIVCKYNKKYIELSDETFSYWRINTMKCKKCKAEMKEKTKTAFKTVYVCKCGFEIVIEKG